MHNPLSDRSSGVLLHPTSLPSGRLDDDVFRWLDFLADSGQSVWQLLPLGIPANGHSPYQCLSAFAANPALLPDDTPIQPELYNENFRHWQETQSFWLKDFSRFALLKQQHDGLPWYQWQADLRDHQAEAMRNFDAAYATQLTDIEWQQYQIYQVWRNVRDAAHQRGISLFGDMPIFVAHDSADVWANRRLFLLDKEGQLLKVTGVPPDYFSATGQRWGNPHYDWKVMQSENFAWWLKRLKSHLQWLDLVRIDHFRGLQAVWMIDQACETAEQGEWVETPGVELLDLLKQKRGDLPLVAEDLGIITPEVTALRKRFSLPGMAVLQFAFDYFDDNPHKPKNISEDTVVYTGTHDNDTSRGWFDSLSEHEKHHVLDELGLPDSDTSRSQIVDSMINAAMKSAAILCITPLQDILGLDTSARMNIPGDNGNHWRWQFDWSQLTTEISQKLRHMTQGANRLRT